MVAAKNMADEQHFLDLGSLCLTSILEKYVNRKVNILMSDGTVKTGWIYTIDPVTRSVVLLENFQDRRTRFQLSMLCRHAVKNIEAVEDTDTLTKEELQEIEILISDQKELNYSRQELDTRRIQLKEWLERNRIPVNEAGVESGVLSVMGVLFVDPPYDVDCCRCNNEIILDRIQNLIRTKPVVLQDDTI